MQPAGRGKEESMRNKTSITSSLNAMATIFLLLFLLSCEQDKTVLSIGSGSGLPGSENNMVEITLENPAGTVKGIQADICDAGNHLLSVGCEPIGDASEFSCVCNELSSGCLRVLLFSAAGDLIQEGSGQVMRISYTVSEDAPAGQCVDLTPQQVLVSNEDNKPLPAVAEKGTFCF